MADPRDTRDTRRRVLDAARALFNARGLSRVGVRDVARALGLSPGNVSYHFPTKDDLVAALMIELHEVNARGAFADLPAEFSLADLYRAALAVMRTILAYRFVLESYGDAVRASPELQRLEAVLEPRRRARSDQMLARLVANGYLDAAALRTNEYLYEQSQMISSGWLRAAAFRPDLGDDESVVRHYAKVGVALLGPYCTEKGRRMLRRVLKGALDDERA